MARRGLKGGVALARRLQRANAAALQPWLKAWQGSATALRDKWLHEHRVPVAAGRWVRDMAVTPAGLRLFQLYLPRTAATPPAAASARAPRPQPQPPRLPLMVMLHGCHQDAAAFAHSTHMHRLADREGFAVLYLQQDRQANAQGCWNWFALRSGRALQEAALVLAAIDQVCRRHAIDAARVALVGLSAGASLAALLAQRHGERFRAVVMHSGVPPGAARDARAALAAMQGRTGAPLLPTAAALAAAARVPWPPLLVIHGDRDTVVSPRNAQAAVVQWVVAGQGRAAATVVQQRGRRLPMAVTRWTRHGADVATLVVVQGLGHGWSGGSAALPFGEPTGPDAGTLAWRFAQRQWRNDGPAATRVTPAPRRP